MMQRIASVRLRLMKYGAFIGIVGGIVSFVGLPHHGLIKEMIAVVIGCMLLGKRLPVVLKETGMGMKSPTRRNFEAGIFTDNPTLVESAMEHFDSVWRGEYCKKCGRRQYCADPIR